jgi:phage shock protein PspC (stress-responsive transcriptional regulator)
VNCTNCGSEVAKGVTYCQKCGNKIEYDTSPKFARAPEQYAGPKKLYRSRKNRLFAGVCGGLGEYWDVDPNIIRILWIIFAFSIVGIFAYLVAIALIPESPLDPWVEPK